MGEAIREIFEQNRVIVLSISGQVFFVLGLAITGRLMRDSHLPLARSLKWLAAFGFLLAVHEWGDVFVPIQGRFLEEPVVGLMLMIQTVILAAAFACLFQFGVATLDLAGGRRGLALAPAVSVSVLLGWAFGPAMSGAANMHDWHKLTMIASRYFICLPAAVVAAWGLRRQAQELIAPLELPHIWRTLRVAGLALAGYAIAGGIVVPQAEFFPASVVNEERVFGATNVPIAVFRGSLGLVLTLAMVRSLQVFREERDRRLAAAQEESALTAERERFARELHDGTLQTVYAAGLLLRSAHRRLSGSPQGEAVAAVERSIGLLDDAVDDLRSTLGELRPAPSGRGLGAELEALVAERYLKAFVDVSLELELGEGVALDPGGDAHVLAIAREALSNVVRHSRARTVHVRARTVANRLQMVIEDDGLGTPVTGAGGSGLRNMRERARLLGGELEIASPESGGTVVALDVPYRVGEERTL